MHDTKVNVNRVPQEIYVNYQDMYHTILPTKISQIPM